MSEATKDRWDALIQGADAVWSAFKNRFDAVMSEYRDGEEP